MNYSEVNAANYSTLSKLAIHPTLAYDVLMRTERNAAFFDIGNYVDEGMYGNPASTHYVVNDDDIPAYDSKAREVAEAVLTTLLDNPSIPATDANIDYLISTSAATIGYYPNWKPETRLEKLRPVVCVYIDVVTKAKRENKSIITVSQRQLAEALISNIKESERFKTVIEGCEISYQKDMYFKFGDVDCKILPDFTLRNEQAKTVRILDIKTYQGSFMDNFYKFRYYYQGAFYSKGVELNHPGYSVLSPIFVAADKDLKMPVRLFEQVEWKEFWEMSSHYVSTGGSRYKTLPQLLREYQYHATTGNWSESYEAIMTGSEKIVLR